MRRFPTNNMVMRIAVRPRPIMVRIMSFCYCSAIISNFCLNPCTISRKADFDLTRITDQSFIFWFRWLPLSPIGASAALQCPACSVRLHNITELYWRATDFKRFEVVFFASALKAHVLPRTALIVNAHDVALHLRKRRIVTDDFLRLNAAQHLMIPRHEPFLLVAAVVMLGRLFFRAEAKIKGTTNVVPFIFGAGDEARTRYLHLGKVALYQMSYTRNSKTDYSGQAAKSQAVILGKLNFLFPAPVPARPVAALRAQ